MDNSIPSLYPLSVSETFRQHLIRSFNHGRFAMALVERSPEPKTILATADTIFVFANECQISPSTLTRFLRAERGMSLDNLSTVGAHLDFWITPLRGYGYYADVLYERVSGAMEHFHGRPESRVHLREFLLHLLHTVRHERSWRLYADSIGISHTILSRFMAGKSSLSLDNIDKIFKSHRLCVAPPDSFRSRAMDDHDDGNGRARPNSQDDYSDGSGGMRRDPTHSADGIDHGKARKLTEDMVRHWHKVLGIDIVSRKVGMTGVEIYIYNPTTDKNGNAKDIVDTNVVPMHLAAEPACGAVASAFADVSSRTTLRAA
jgi:hypothetical protein